MKVVLSQSASRDLDSQIQYLIDQHAARTNIAAFLTHCEHPTTPAPHVRRSAPDDH